MPSKISTLQTKLKDLPDGSPIPEEIDKALQGTTEAQKPIPVKKLTDTGHSLGISYEMPKIINEANLVKPPIKTQKWKVTPYMEKWISTAVQLVTDSPSEIAPVCGVSREVWYDWIKKPGFKEWFYQQYKAKRYEWIPKLDAMGMARAPKNFDYWKAMNQKAGELLEGQGVNIQGQQVVAILGGMSVSTVPQPKQEQESVIGQESIDKEV
jgi:hypothetical protein